MLRNRTPGDPRRRRRRRVAAAVVGLLLVAFAGWLVVPAALTPGNDSLTARIAERARDNGLGFVVTAAESLQYQLSPPREGGALDPAARRSLAAASSPCPSSSSSCPGSSPGPTGSAPGSAGPAVTASASAASPLAASAAASRAVTVQAPLQPFASPALAGEGVYSARATVAGQPALQVALLRPDAVHTSYLAGVAWMSSRLLRFVQHPGVTDPGRLSWWSAPAVVPPDRRAGLVATFNSGFKIADSRGAFYADGHSVGTLRPGAASLVIYADGHADIGSWGSDVVMTPQVRSVRQNLDLLLRDGRPTPVVDADVQTAWGATIGQKAYVWRSGVGVTAAGDVVFVGGDALSARTLAALLQRAGAVRAMELDINRSWVSFMWYSAAPGGSAVPHKLVDFSRPADRYFSPNNRDFFAVYAR